MLQARRVLLAPIHLNVSQHYPALNAAWKHSKSVEIVHDFVYFHTPEVDLFWHYLERGEDGQARSLDLSSAEYGEKQRQWHNQRIIEDWRDYRQGIHEQPEKLQRLQVCHGRGEYTRMCRTSGRHRDPSAAPLQVRLEKDMLDNAYVERTRQVLSAIRRGTHTSDAMAMQWMQAAKGASTFLQVQAFTPHPANS